MHGDATPCGVRLRHMNGRGYTHSIQSTSVAWAGARLIEHLIRHPVAHARAEALRRPPGAWTAVCGTRSHRAAAMQNRHHRCTPWPLHCSRRPWRMPRPLHASPALPWPHPAPRTRLVQQQGLDGSALPRQRALELRQCRHVKQGVPAQLAQRRLVQRVVQEPHLGGVGQVGGWVGEWGTNRAGPWPYTCKLKGGWTASLCGPHQLVLRAGMG